MYRLAVVFILPNNSLSPPFNIRGRDGLSTFNVGDSISTYYKDLTVTYFDNKVNNLINWNSPSKQYQNIEGTSRLKGYEASYRKDIISFLFQ